MKTLELINNFIDSSKLEIHYENNKLYIVNYIDVIDFNSNKIVFSSNIGNVTILGDNLVISKLLSKEMIISGDVYNINLR